MPNFFEKLSQPLFAADFHYFRLAPEKWELMQARLAQMGVSMLTITVPWGFHELEKGRIDLHGATSKRRDLIRLLQLCHALDLHCILKPGPYSEGSGIIGNGLPHWLAPEPSTFASDLAAATQGWYKALSKASVDRQWPHGPIVALDLNIESSLIETPVYSEQLTDVQWPIWLRKRYRGIDALNEIYGSTYRSVSQVTFPERLSRDSSPLAEDARAFLAEIQADLLSNYEQTLIDAGWQIPVYPFALDTVPQLPVIKNHSLLEPADLADLDLTHTLLNLQHPIQVDPDPVDIGSSPTWAKTAPIRGDGSLRQTFRQIRHTLWSKSLPNSHLEGTVLTADLENGGLVSAGQDSSLKIRLPTGTKPKPYRLRLNGELQRNDTLKVSRGNLSGAYQTEQDDLVLYLNEPNDPIAGFQSIYLRRLLAAQTQTLLRCAGLAAALGESLGSASALSAAPATPKPKSYTLAQARRGLNEADNILRKALASIGGLEAGFETMLGRDNVDIPEPAAASVPISPEIFEGKARQTLVEIGQSCGEIAPKLKSAAGAIQNRLDAGQEITLEQYQQSYSLAIATAQAVRPALLELIARLRIDMASEELPLVAWRVHNQIQAVAESLRWGVLRG